ncbi:MAG: heparinase II/III family protein [Bacteroidales bacterium]|nr:heparinase II/III family protein [Bacteroidales bacterium]
MSKRIFCLLAALLVAMSLSAQQPRHLFRTAWAAIDTASVRPASWKPYPAWRDRAAWDRLMPADLKEQAIKDGEKWLNYRFQAILASEYLEFERSGSRAAMEVPNSRNRSALKELMLAELAEGKGRFLEQIINGAWFFAGSPSWVLSAHEYRKNSGRALPDYRDVIMDLGSQLTGGDVALSLYFFRDEMDKIDPAISAFIEHALDEKIYKPYLDPAKWRAQSWLGFTHPGEEKPYFWENWDPRNNWNIWCNFAVAQIACLACRDRGLLQRILAQAVESADNYIDFVKMDGGCDEGPAYWRHASGSLFEFIELMNRITDGKFGCWDDPQFRARCCYISRCNLGDGWAVNFGDGQARYTGLPSFLYWMGTTAGIKEIHDYSLYVQACRDHLTTIDPGTYLYDKLDFLPLLPQMKKEYAETFAAAGGDLERMKRELRKDLPAWTWYPQTEHLIARNAQGLAFAAKGGHNEESHNHNDVGTVILFMDEMPVLVDVGPTTYMRQTFNKKERYTIWSMRSEWHNLPMMNGCPQHEGGEYRAAWSKADEKAGSFTTEFAGAYPAEAGLVSLQRNCVLKGSTLSITDRYALSQRKAADEEHFMVRGEVTLVKEGQIRIRYRSFDGSRHGSALMTYPKTLKASIETRVLDDKRHLAIWGKDLKRIVLRSADNAPLKGSYTVSISKL